MTLNDLFKLYGIDISKSKIKLLRHETQEYDLKEIYNSGHFNAYQSIQSKPWFDKCDFVVSFLGDESKEAARFIGIYKNEGRITPASKIWPKNYPHPKMPRGSFEYKLTPIDIMEDLKDRLVIDWGKGTRNWAQWLYKDKPKEVLEIRQAGFLRSFTGYTDLLLRFDELVQILEHPRAHQDWISALSSAGGIYLILGQDGKQYIGSATGENGILGRWSEYAKNGHGGNKQLKDLVGKQPDAKKHFRFSILEIFSKSLSRKTAESREAIYKRKLGSRDFGFNSN